MANANERSGPPTALVLVAEGGEEIETYAPADVLVRAGFDVMFAGVSGLSPTGSRGLPMRADRLIGVFRGQLFDAIVIPGGDGGAKTIAASDEAKLRIQHHADAGRVVAAICASPALVLGPMGLLDGKRATGYPSTRDMFPDSAMYVEKDVVEDGNLITSKGPATAVAFGLAIARRLTSEATAREVAEGMLV
ncbi:MAG: DJ-1 family glyoxalase III [Planctomycetota bacterium]